MISGGNGQHCTQNQYLLLQKNKSTSLDTAKKARHAKDALSWTGCHFLMKLPEEVCRWAANSGQPLALLATFPIGFSLVSLRNIPQSFLHPRNWSASLVRMARPAPKFGSLKAPFLQPTHLSTRDKAVRPGQEATRLVIFSHQTVASPTRPGLATRD